VALMRWRWVLGPVLAALVLAVLALPPQVPVGEGLLGSVFGTENSGWSPHDPARAAVRGAVRTQRRRLSEQMLVDSITRVARGAGALRSGDGAITVVYAPPLTRDSAAGWLEAAAGELALYPRSDTDGLPIVVALSLGPARGRDASLRLLLERPVLTLREESSSAACVVILNLARARAVWYARELVAHDAARRPLGRFLDTCALYGRFGRPGPAISAWADRGPAWYWGGYDRLSRRMQEARRAMKPDTVEADWTYSTYWQGAVQWAPIACLRGGTTTCARIAGLAGYPSRGLWWPYTLTRGQMLAWMLATGTPQQFAAFWRSPLPPAQAIEAAYGQPAGTLALAAFRHWASPPKPGGPLASSRVVLAGIGWAALALALALVAGRRWKTET
jgi:hypothetical protein